MSLRFSAKIDNLSSVTDQIITEADKAATGAMDEVTVGLKTDLRQQVEGAGLGHKLALTWQGRRYPISGASADASAFVWSKAPKLIDAFNRGAVIRSSEGFYLAIPTPAAGVSGVGSLGQRQKITPGGWERRTGQRLRFVYRRGRPSLLVADNARLSKSGLARGGISRKKGGGDFVRVAGRVTVVIFILVPQVSLRKRLDIESIANTWAGRVPDLVVRHWR